MNTCTFITIASIQKHLALIRTKGELETIDFESLAQFLQDVKRCPIHGEAFSLLITQYEPCLALAENPNLTPQQIIAMLECESVKAKENTGNETIFEKLLRNKGNSTESLKYVEEKQKSVLYTNGLPNG